MVQTQVRRFFNSLIFKFLIFFVSFLLYHGIIPQVSKTGLYETLLWRFAPQSGYADISELLYIYIFICSIIYIIIIKFSTSFCDISPTMIGRIIRMTISDMIWVVICDAILIPRNYSIIRMTNSDIPILWFLSWKRLQFATKPEGRFGVLSGFPLATHIIRMMICGLVFPTFCGVIRMTGPASPPRESCDCKLLAGG
jgi:hypothetical protein